MKLTQLVNLLAIVAVVSLSAGCANSKQGVTQIPSRSGNKVADDSSGKMLDGEQALKETNPKDMDLSQPSPDKYSRRDDSVFQAYNVHFEYDSPSVRSSEKSKVEHVADYLKANPANGVEVSGHCDERGTDQYNFSLGERRALAVRDELIQLGIEANRIQTVSFGRSRPVDSGRTEEARAKNRRDQFVLLSQ